MTAAATPARRFGGRSRGVLCVLLVSAFHLVTIRDGHDWGDDFSMYIRHAENLARGAPYAETGYIYNPHNPAVGPRTYPPGFPVLLAPIVRYFAEIGASYVATGPDEPDFDVAYLHGFVARYRGDLRLVWHSGGLAVYRIERHPCEPIRP